MILDEGSRSPVEVDEAYDGPALATDDAAALEREVSSRVFGAGTDPGLGLLLDLAKKGEYDPWDVDIVAVTDRYLAVLDEHLDARDLGEVARLIFYAAALIHLKAQALAEREAQRSASQDDLLAGAELELLEDLGDGVILSRLRPDDEPLVYPDFMSDRRRGLPLAPRERPPRSRGLTLIDLIVALRGYDDRLAEREAELAAQEAFEGEITFEESISTAHQDDLDGDIIRVREELWARLGEDQSLSIDDLVRPERTRAATYLALLFLAQDEEVAIDQETFYGELRVSRGRYFGEVRAGLAPTSSEEEGDVEHSEEEEVELSEEEEEEVEHEHDHEHEHAEGSDDELTLDDADDSGDCGEGAVAADDGEEDALAAGEEAAL